MGGREAPGGIVDPTPAPRLDPGPMAVAVWRPSRIHGGIPDWAIAGRVAPRAVAIQFLVADYAGRQIVGGLAAGLVGVAIFGPRLKPIGLRRILYVVSELIGTRELRAIAGVQGKVLAAAIDIRLAAADHRPGSRGIRVGIEAILATARDGDGGVGRVHFEAVAVGQMARAQDQLALGEADLHEVVVQIEKAHAGLGTEAQHRIIQMQLGARVGIGPQVVTRGEGPVHDGGRPIVGAGGLDGNIARNKVQVRDARRRVLRVSWQHEQAGKSCGK